MKEKCSNFPHQLEYSAITHSWASQLDERITETTISSTNCILFSLKIDGMHLSNTVHSLRCIPGY